VVSLGALDMVNFGPLQPVPERFADRNLYVHNPTVTLMRTTPAENAELGRRIAEKLNAAAAPTALFVPLSGVSAIDAEGQPFHDPVADDALFAAPRAGLDRDAVEVHEIVAKHQRPPVRHGHGRSPPRADPGARLTRREVLSRLRRQRAAGVPVIGAGAGTGLSAKCAEAGGADLIIISTTRAAIAWPGADRWPG
jgi:hypothetical protein